FNGFTGSRNILIVNFISIAIQILFYYFWITLLKLRKMEIFKKPFVQVTVPPFNKQNSSNGIKAQKLLSLIDDVEHKKFIIKHYNLDSLDFIILVDNIDVAFKYVEFVHNKYKYV